MRRVVIVGGGFGRPGVAKALANQPVAVTFVDRCDLHLFQPLLYQVALAGLSPADIAAPIRSVLRRDRNLQVLMGEVAAVDRRSAHRPRAEVNMRKRGSPKAIRPVSQRDQPVRRAGRARAARPWLGPTGWHRLRWLAVLIAVVVAAVGVVRALHQAAHGTDWAWQDNGNGTITDLFTGRMWQQANSAQGLIFQDAVRYCAQLDLGGFRDWRPPQRHELESLINPWRSEGRRCPPGFPAGVEMLWSGTPQGSENEHAWAVNCASGDRWHYAASSLFRVRCVR